MKNIIYTIRAFFRLNFRHAFYFFLMLTKKKLFRFFFIYHKREGSQLSLTPILDPLFDIRTKSHFINKEKASFINQELKLFPKWNPAGSSILWKFQLHSFEYLGTIKSHDQGIYFIDDWLENNIPDPNLSWHPYNLSLRICNWIWYISSINDIYNEKFKHIVKSLYHQTSFLVNHLEREKEGNHLIENCKAIIISGYFFNKTEWVKKGFKILQIELKRQIYKEGSHYEKSAMYHSIVLECLVTIYFTSLNDDSSYTIKVILLENIRKMTIYLSDIMLKNQLPIQHDSCRNISSDFKKLYKKINEITKIENNNNITQMFYEEIGNYVYKNNNIYLLFDAGNPEPNFRPGHSHNSTFHYDLYLDNKPVLIDSGVYNYEDNKERNYFRSTQSHNTIQINSTELNQIWGSFRMLVDGRVKNVSVAEKIISAEHNFYEKSENCKINRKLKILENDIGISVDDTVISEKPNLIINDHLHFSPNISILEKKESVGEISYKLNSGNTFLILKIYKTNNEEVHESFSFCSKEFNKKQERLKLTIKCLSKNNITNIKYDIYKG